MVLDFVEGEVLDPKFIEELLSLGTETKLMTYRSLSPNARDC
jgi:hypothetical protein